MNILEMARAERADFAELLETVTPDLQRPSAVRGPAGA